MEEKLIVFISSRINDEMKRARQVVHEAIEELPLTRPWLFEEAPAAADPLDASYLRWVGKCDLFILLLGEDITDPVRVEWETATQARKPRLVFLRKGAQNDAAWEFAKGLDVKWKEYRTLAELKREVQVAVGDELIKGYRAYGVNEAERADLQEHVRELRVGDVVYGDKVGGDKVAGAKIMAETYVDKQIIVTAREEPAAPPDPAQAMRIYLTHVIDRYQYLQQGIRSAGELVSIELEEIYITLNAVQKRTMPAEEMEEMLARLGRRVPGDERLAGEMMLREREVEVVLSVNEALSDQRRLVVLGAPGSGKTTFLQYLALTYARDLRGDKPGLVQERLGLVERLMPVFLPLRDFARHLQAEYPNAGTDGPALLLNYLSQYFAAQEILLPKSFFRACLESGQAAVLLDGMDEVADSELRRRVARIIEALTRRYPGNRYVVTSRIVGYQGPARLGESYFVTTVRDFDQAAVERFVSNWSLAVEVALAGRRSRTIERQAEGLLAAIRANERVRELAVNPLLLTVIALVHRYRAHLPERRAELYEECLEVLLGYWDEAKGLREISIPGLAMDAGDKCSLLEPIALWMHERQLREIDCEMLLRQLRRLFEPLSVDGQEAGKRAEAFVEVIGARSGLLQERGLGVYSFSHLTFQEYLTARAVAGREDYIEYSLARVDDPWWREVLLLTAGYLSTKGKGRVTAFIRALMEHREEPETYQNLVLAAKALREVVQEDRVEGDVWSEVYSRIRQGLYGGPSRRFAKFVGFLMKTLNLGPAYDFIKPHLPEGLRSKMIFQMVRVGGSRRNAAARALAEIRETYWIKPYGEPKWIEIPAGEFWMGSDKVYDREKPAHRVYMERFQIAPVPVTNTQYWIFIKATGHAAPSHWEDNEPPRGLENHPVVNVSWHDALAYCRWLSKVTDKPITLPSEAQWEKAARGDKDKREYPWGYEWDETRCNALELGLGVVTPVGIFPEGTSPYGCLDMAGNVWEWTVSLWGEDRGKPDFKYPYKPEDGREDLKAADNIRRALRGGSFSNDRSYARCAARDREYPINHARNHGFRVCVVSQ